MHEKALERLLAAVFILNTNGLIGNGEVFLGHRHRYQLLGTLLRWGFKNIILLISAISKNTSPTLKK